MDNNNLDKLFQEQLKNLEETPNKNVWNNIESKLKKKKRRVVPVWWFASGIAAMLVLGMLFFPFSNDNKIFNKTDSDIIITESTKKEIKLETTNKTKVDAAVHQEKIEEKTLVADKKRNKIPVKKQIIKTKNIDNIKKSILTQNKKEKVFFADNSIRKNRDSIKQKKNINYDNSTIFSDKKNKITKTKKELITNKTDLNKFVEKNDSLFSPKLLKKKWSISPVFAVLNSNSFSNTSPIDKSLFNTTEGKSSISYGLKIGFKINNKWSIQSGIHLQEMSFSNNQVNAIGTISKNSSSVSFNNGNSFSFNEMAIQSSDFTSNSIISRTSINGDLNQQYGYIEIPIEVKYNFLSTKKFTTEIVAGFSSLFLNKNKIYLESQFQSQSGKASNLNNINFSGNLGFDFNYSLNRNWSLNLNPMFKAQLHTFSENSNGFAPFNLGIYSGIQYKF